MHVVKVSVFVALLVSTAAFSASGIVGSVHDFSSEGWSGGQICLPCHTPHNADLTVSAAPLWNHEVTAATYQLYSSPTMDATVTQPSGTSKLCLSCHDGTVAIDSFGGNTGTQMVDAEHKIGTDLRGTHPISITYDAALAAADGELFDPSTKTTGAGGTIENDLLFNNRLECASCHDVHNKGLGSSTLLRIDNAGSALCLTCHDK